MLLIILQKENSFHTLDIKSKLETGSGSISMSSNER